MQQYITRYRFRTLIVVKHLKRKIHFKVTFRFGKRHISFCRLYMNNYFFEKICIMKDLFVSFMNKFLYQIFETLVFLLIFEILLLLSVMIYQYYIYDWIFIYDYKIWQYSKSGTVDGISGEVNLSIAIQDYSNAESVG